MARSSSTTQTCSLYHHILLSSSEAAHDPPVPLYMGVVRQNAKSALAYSVVEMVDDISQRYGSSSNFIAYTAQVSPAGEQAARGRIACGGAHGSS